MGRKERRPGGCFQDSAGQHQSQSSIHNPVQKYHNIHPALSCVHKDKMPSRHRHSAGAMVHKHSR